MKNPPDFDLAAAHRYFAADCFNRAWDFIDSPHRTAQNDLRMVALSQASLSHWLERADCDDQKLSIGYWQLSRIYALTGNAAEAERYGRVCLKHSGQLEPFYLGYAHEALARAAMVAGDSTAAADHKSKAMAQANLVTSNDDRAGLLADLASLKVDG